MKLLLTRLTNKELYERFTSLKARQEQRKLRIMYAKAYMERHNNLHPSEIEDELYDILNLRPCKKSHLLVMELYTLKDSSSLEKEFPL